MCPSISVFPKYLAGLTAWFIVLLYVMSLTTVCIIITDESSGESLPEYFGVTLNLTSSHHLCLYELVTQNLILILIQRKTFQSFHIMLVGTMVSLFFLFKPKKRLLRHLIFLFFLLQGSHKLNKLQSLMVLQLSR